MKQILILIFSTLSFSLQASIIDLGDLSIEGEVRRPLITTIQAPQYTRELAKKSAIRNYDQIVLTNLKTQNAEEFLKRINSVQQLKEEVLK